MNKKPFPFTEKNYSSDEQSSQPRRESTYGERPYEPRGYFSHEETIDPFLVDQIIEQAPARIRLLVDKLQDNNEVLCNNRLKRLLLHGLPGNGKTLLAKAIALKTLGKYYFVQTPDLLDSWKNSHQNLKKEIDFLAKNNEPIVIIFDELDQLTNQHKNKNSSDSTMPTALWSLLDYCERKVPRFFFIGTTNNGKNDFPPQLISRFGKNNIICIPNPTFAIRKQVICCYLNKRKHNLSENDINDFAQRLEGRTCRDIQGIVDDAAIFTPKNNTIITLNEIRLAEEANPYEPSEDEIIARELGIPIERVIELNNMEPIIEKKHVIIDYQQKKSSHNHAVASQDQNHRQAVASFDQTAAHYIADFNKRDSDLAQQAFLKLTTDSVTRSKQTNNGLNYGGNVGGSAGLLGGANGGVNVGTNWGGSTTCQIVLDSDYEKVKNTLSDNQVRLLDILLLQAHVRVTTAQAAQGNAQQNQPNQNCIIQ